MSETGTGYGERVRASRRGVGHGGTPARRAPAARTVRPGGPGSLVRHAPGYGPENYAPEILHRTREAIEALGWTPEPELCSAPSDETLGSVAAKCRHSDDSGPTGTMPKPGPKPGKVV